MRPGTGITGPRAITHNIGGTVSGRKIVTTAGMAEPLAASSTLCEKVDVVAELDNTGVVCVGGSNVIAAAATRTGVPLKAGDHYTFEVDDVADIYIDAEVNGEGVTFNYFT